MRTYVHTDEVTIAALRWHRAIATNVALAFMNGYGGLPVRERREIM
jgi:hypothetical protein